MWRRFVGAAAHAAGNSGSGMAATAATAAAACARPVPTTAAVRALSSTAADTLAGTASDCDVVVVGGGHAGVEAAAAASRRGARTVLVTPSPAASIGEMSCNPSIGGLAKGTLVREVDALDGLMVSAAVLHPWRHVCMRLFAGHLALQSLRSCLPLCTSSGAHPPARPPHLLQGRAADAAGIQFRMLNASKGPAVRGPRAQMDRLLYKRAVQALLRQVPHLEVHDGAVVDLLMGPGPAGGSTSGPAVVGVVLASGEVLRCTSVVITTGTFLRGVIHVGSQSRPAGRIASLMSARAAARGEGAVRAAEMTDVADEVAAGAASHLSRRFADLGFALGRLKTGTPPRLDGAWAAWLGCADLLLPSRGVSALPSRPACRAHHRLERVRGAARGRPAHPLLLPALAAATRAVGAARPPGVVLPNPHYRCQRGTGARVHGGRCVCACSGGLGLMHGRTLTLSSPSAPHLCAKCSAVNRVSFPTASRPCLQPQAGALCLIVG